MRPVAVPALAEREGNCFFWAGELLARLRRYAQGRERYPTPQWFMVKTAAGLNAASSRVDEYAAAHEERHSEVLSLGIENVATDPEQ